MEKCNNKIPLAENSKKILNNFNDNFLSPLGANDESTRINPLISLQMQIGAFQFTSLLPHIFHSVQMPLIFETFFKRGFSVILFQSLLHL